MSNKGENKNNYRIVVIVIVVSFYLFDLILEQIEKLILEDLKQNK